MLHHTPMNRPWRSVVLVLALWVAYVPAPALADSQTYIVQPGDTLFQIGLRYNVDWREIQLLNQLGGTWIYPGQELLIPLADTIPSAPAEPTPAEQTPAEPAPDIAPARTHVVQRGESLYAISITYGVTWQDLAAANALANPRWIYAGQTLIIPGAAVAPATPAPAVEATPPVEPTAAPAPSSSAAKRIVIDISDQHLWAYDGEVEVFSFVASTGLPGLDTRPGEYSVLNKIPSAWGGNWGIWMPDWLGIYWAGSLQNGIHSLPILPDGSRLWDGYLGTPVSYGCIILGVTESKQLYDWAEVGVPVIITS